MERPGLLADPDGWRPHPMTIRGRDRRGPYLAAPAPDRDATADHRRLADRIRRRLPPLADPVDGSYLPDLLPGMMIMSFGLGPCSSASRRPRMPASRRQGGLAAALLNASQQIGGALGLAIFSAIATSAPAICWRAAPLRRRPSPRDSARAGGLQRLSCWPPAVVALRIANTRGEEVSPVRTRSERSKAMPWSRGRAPSRSRRGPAHEGADLTVTADGANPSGR